MHRMKIPIDWPLLLVCPPALLLPALPYSSWRRPATPIERTHLLVAAVAERVEQWKRDGGTWGERIESVYFGERHGEMEKYGEIILMI